MVGQPRRLARTTFHSPRPARRVPAVPPRRRKPIHDPARSYGARGSTKAATGGSPRPASGWHTPRVPANGRRFAGAGMGRGLSGVCASVDPGWTSVGPPLRESRNADCRRLFPGSCNPVGHFGRAPVTLALDASGTPPTGGEGARTSSNSGASITFGEMLACCVSRRVTFRTVRRGRRCRAPRRQARLVAATGGLAPAKG